MLTTKSWAKSLGLPVSAKVSAVKGYNKKCPRSARQIAIRVLVLHGIVAVAFGVDSSSVIDWFRKQKIWRYVTPQEKAFLTNPKPTKEVRCNFVWHKEAEWALLWTISKIGSLGLPTKECDTRKMIDKIIPKLGCDVEGFIASAKLRSPGELLAEDDRTYNLWCCVHTVRSKKELPPDLNGSVLYERRYAFEWLDGNQDWDDVTCDA